ncbi:lantibiotic dehydratase [Sphaerisporangium krabiense]|uniref:Lantibiotic dehydratase n=1 Tax=Sphaerisporangium krabiense TaxID=763782 RepID=A0A7W9DT13_9ACTN|nr:lantibiotic dehydratase [Sphaerisporangium krabiense]MBB5630156.1 hypothetical protein [Sphaerisporangium krabiense]GII65107.1 lantibiotic dehydratase [Sphaerisporangium krabiense]
MRGALDGSPAGMATAAYPGRPLPQVRVDGALSFGDGRLRWDLLPWALLRTPGFPVTGLAGLAAPELLTATDEAASLREALDAPRRELLTTSAVPPREVRRAVVAGRRLGDREVAGWSGAPAGAVARWNGLVDAVAVADGRVADLYAAARRRADLGLAGLFRDPRLQQAVFLSSQTFFTHGLPRVLALASSGGAADKRERRAVGTAARYLRRLSVRCEQTSFFGPTHFVHLDPEVAEPLALGVPGAEQVYAEPGIWLLELLARTGHAETPMERRRPRRHPLFRLGEGRLVSASDGRFKRVGERALRLWVVLDGERTLAEACRAAGIAVEDAPALLGELGPVVIHATPLPSHEMYPLATLLAAEDDPHGPAHRVARAAAAFAARPWPERRAAFHEAEAVAEELGAEARRGEGRHYVDRYVLHEERAHPLSGRTVLGGPAVAGMARALEAVLPLSYLAALVAREDAREALRAATGGRRTPLARAGTLHIPPVTHRSDALRAHLASLVAARAGQAVGVPGTEVEVVHLTREDIAGLVAAHVPVPVSGEHLAAVAGPDLMAAGPLGEATWVLGELHDDGAYNAGGVTRLHPDGETLRADFERRLVEVFDPAEMAAVVSRRRNKFLLPEMPGTGVEVAGFSVKPRARTVPIAEVDIDADGAAVVVEGRRLRLYSGELPSQVHRALAVPALNPVTVETGTRTPRIVVDGVVVQRARWRLRTPGGLRDLPAWEAAQRLRREAGLPRRVFVRHPDEPKPLFVDFADVHAVADLMRPPAAEVIVTEMLPDYPDLWWRPDGDPVCAELRTSCLVWWEREAATRPGGDP